MKINEITKNFNIINFDFADGGAFHEEGQIDIFLNVLEKVNSETPTMFELGSYEAFYSILFNKFFKNKNKKNICLEICKSSLEVGRKNAISNDCKDIYFEYANIGIPNLAINNGKTQFNNLEVSNKNLTLKYLFNTYNIDILDILHVDIQGSEASLLEEIQKEKFKIKYYFINIHDDASTNNFYGYSVYDNCKQILNSFNVEYIYDNRIYGGYGDGLIVAKNKDL
jgi:hypothetical protein